MQPQPYRSAFEGRRSRLAAGFCAWLLLVVAMLCAASGASADEVLQAHGYKMAGDAARTRIVAHFDREPEMRWFLLRSPHRMVIDLPEAGFAFDDAELEPRGLVTEVRYGNLDEGRSRIILSFDGPFAVERMDILENEIESRFPPRCRYRRGLREGLRNGDGRTDRGNRFHSGYTQRRPGRPCRQ
ncbi:AMIN domain-containing protein [Neoaquamicrobium sediminum]|uniref:AMIN domain-containing protein n=1 Tax=Neoaquamicrobium sediminum TaxID=1849104 RepID=UPI0028B0CEF4|nr:AMIN domain-containing protein [Mesorhizobium sediminum]